MKEMWKDIVGYEGLYIVSSYGRVKGKRGYLSIQKHRQGYLRVDLFKNNVKKRYYVHRLVALAFIENPNNLPCVLHKDDNPENSKVNNLFWGSLSDNMQDMIKKGRSNKFHKPVLCLGTGEIFRTAKSAALEYNVSPSTIRQAVTTHWKACGYHWEYL
jgi:hypothetical protein